MHRFAYSQRNIQKCKFNLKIFIVPQFSLSIYYSLLHLLVADSNSIADQQQGTDHHLFWIQDTTPFASIEFLILFSIHVYLSLLPSAGELSE